MVAGFVFDFRISKAGGVDGGISKVRSGAAGNFVFLARFSIFDLRFSIFKVGVTEGVSRQAGYGDPRGEARNCRAFHLGPGQYRATA